MLSLEDKIVGYALREKQREYQREWLRAKKERLFKEDPSTGSEFRVLRSGVVTWEELQDGFYLKVNSYAECVSKAKDRLETKRSDRLAIAALAMRACEIRHGGDRRTQKYKESQDRTLKKFASDIQVNLKTLHSWVRAREFIMEYVPKDSPIDFTAAIIASQGGVFKKNNPNESPLDLYQRLLRQDGPARDAYNAIRALGAVESVLRKRGREKWGQSEIETFDLKLRAIGKLSSTKVEVPMAAKKTKKPATKRGKVKTKRNKKTTRKARKLTMR